MKIETAKRFAALFNGRKDAVGLDRGGVEKMEVTTRLYSEHLRGLPEAGIGIFPVRDDGTVKFAAIDLDEPDFNLARELAELLPGPAWLERSRSGNAHVWWFFDAPIPAWQTKGVLRAATTAVGRPDVEVFPKQAELRPGMVGNYINLPFYGDERPIIWRTGDHFGSQFAYTLEGFLDGAEKELASVEEWASRARAVGVQSPDARAETSEFGERSKPHICATYMLEHKDDNPLAPGHRSVVLFNLAKMLLNVRTFSTEEVLEVVQIYNEASFSPLPQSEVERFVRNAERGEFTSTGCDDPLMSPYVHPDCPIANG